MIVLVLKFFQKIFNSWAYCFSKYFFHIWKNFILREDQTFLVCFFFWQAQFVEESLPFNSCLYRYVRYVDEFTLGDDYRRVWHGIFTVDQLRFHLNYDKHDLWFLPFSCILFFTFKIHHSRFKILWKFFISLLYDKILIQFSLQIFHYKLI